MKKVFALMLVFSLGFGLVSCSSDDDSNDGPNYSVVGKWKVTARTFDGQPVEITCQLNGVRQFKNDGTYLQDDYQIDETTGECTETIDSPLIGTWSKSGDDFTTVIDGTTSHYDIEFVNESKFTLETGIDGSEIVLTYSKVN